MSRSKKFLSTLVLENPIGVLKLLGYFRRTLKV